MRNLLLALALILGGSLAQAQNPPVSSAPAVARVWHGRTKTARADEYFKYLTEAGIEKIKAVPGNLGPQVWRRADGDVTEFTVVSYWPSRDPIRAFAGEEMEKTHSLPRDPEFLLEIEPTVRHFDIVLNEIKSDAR